MKNLFCLLILLLFLLTGCTHFSEYRVVDQGLYITALKQCYKKIDFQKIKNEEFKGKKLYLNLIGFTGRYPEEYRENQQGLILEKSLQEQFEKLKFGFVDEKNADMIMTAIAEIHGMVEKSTPYPWKVLYNQNKRTMKIALHITVFDNKKSEIIWTGDGIGSSSFITEFYFTIFGPFYQHGNTLGNSFRMSQPLPKTQSKNFITDNFITGAVVDINGKPVAGALVNIFREYKEIQQFITNYTGRYRSKELPEGIYTIKTWKKGYEPAESVVTIDTQAPNSPISIVIEKSPAQ
ncbi:MAG: carboxypeptidase-like regulatory domain-containing protein [Elusimicrobiota bacterium]